VTTTKGAHVVRDWRGVDEGWGRLAADFATLSEPSNCREYVAVHHRLKVDDGDRLLDVACGSGLAVELAGLRGARCAGIDAAARLVAVARDRCPDADIRVGDMHDLPWDDGAFDVVTSFRGVWGTTPDAVREIHRVLAPGGRIGLTVWGHIKVSPGVWALSPFRLADEPTVANQAAMVALGRPGAGEQLLAGHGFVDVQRVDVPFAWEFPDPQMYARAGLHRPGLRGHPHGRRAGVPRRGGARRRGAGARGPAAARRHRGDRLPGAQTLASRPRQGRGRRQGRDLSGSSTITALLPLWTNPGHGRA
jgi:SAM-dependent methyltransferase